VAESIRGRQATVGWCQACLRAHEAQLNAFEQYTTQVDGQRLHFLHIRSSRRDAVPLVLAHGWPGSIVELLDCIRPLADPVGSAAAFHLVIPSMPGFGFSGPTTERGWHARRAAAAIGAVMDELGYARFGIQGGDYGAKRMDHQKAGRSESILGHVLRPSNMQSSEPVPSIHLTSASVGNHSSRQGTLKGCPDGRASNVECDAQSSEIGLEAGRRNPPVRGP
jgi:epoxide hydrolase